MQGTMRRRTDAARAHATARVTHLVVRHLVDALEIVLRLSFRLVDEQAAARRKQRCDVRLVLRVELHHVARRSLERAAALATANRDERSEDAVPWRRLLRQHHRFLHECLGHRDRFEHRGCDAPSLRSKNEVGERAADADAKIDFHHTRHGVEAPLPIAARKVEGANGLGRIVCAAVVHAAAVVKASTVYGVRGRLLRRAQPCRHLRDPPARERERESESES